MQSAWLLPEDIADVLPAAARHLEALRRSWLDLAQAYGYELVVPPLVEYLESLLSGTGHSLDLKTFKLIDQLTGRTMGLRADSTPQAARIDAHLLNRAGVTRLCYCGPVVHTRADGPQASREPMQFGAEIYGERDIDADVEVIELALDGLAMAGIAQPVVDLGDARILRALLAGLPLDASGLERIIAALTAKDPAALVTATVGVPSESADALLRLPELYGGDDTLDRARQVLPARPLLAKALDDLAAVTRRIGASHPEARIVYDLADHSGHAYYTGTRFSMFAPGGHAALVRGGRYDEVGAVFGRNRPAAGFGLDLKVLGTMSEAPPQRSAIAAPWLDDDGLRASIRKLRAMGETVLCLKQGDHPASDSFLIDRELIHAGDRWVVQSRPYQQPTSGTFEHKQQPA